MTLGHFCVKKPTEVVFHNALKLCSCEKLIIILSLKYCDVDSKIFNKLFQCRGLSSDRESQFIRSTEICLKVFILPGGQHFWALCSFIMGFNSFTCSLGISTSLSKTHLINWHEMPLFIENIGEEAENNAKQKYDSFLLQAVTTVELRVFPDCSSLVLFFVWVN